MARRRVAKCGRKANGQFKKCHSGKKHRRRHKR
jgi:hypothetical protein